MTTTANQLLLTSPAEKSFLWRRIFFFCLCLFLSLVFHGSLRRIVYISPRHLSVGGSQSKARRWKRKKWRNTFAYVLHLALSLSLSRLLTLKSYTVWSKILTAFVKWSAFRRLFLLSFLLSDANSQFSDIIWMFICQLLIGKQ